MAQGKEQGQVRLGRLGRFQLQSDDIFTAPLLNVMLHRCHASISIRGHIRRDVLSDVHQILP